MRAFPRTIRTEVSRAKTGVRTFDYEVLDQRGRAIGVRVDLGTFELGNVEITDPNDGRCSWPRLEVGFYFTWTTHGLRDGRAHGPLQTTHYCATAEERELAVAKFLRDAATRARKTYGPKASSSGDAAEVLP